jgi:hypothetical protein
MARWMADAGSSRLAASKQFATALLQRWMALEKNSYGLPELPIRHSNSAMLVWVAILMTLFVIFSGVR